VQWFCYFVVGKWTVLHGSWTSRVTSVVHQHLPHHKTLITWVNHFVTVTYLKHPSGLVWDQPPVRWLCGAFLPGVKRRCMKLTTRLHPVLSVRISRGTPPGPPYVHLQDPHMHFCLWSGSVVYLPSVSRFSSSALLIPRVHPVALITLRCVTCCHLLMLRWIL
jgi:hypothetical protein